MSIPLIILAALSILGGFIGIPEVLGGTNSLHHWLEPIVGKAEEIISLRNLHPDHSLEIPLMIVSVVIAAFGIFLATRYYKKKTTLQHDEEKIGAAYKLAYNKFYVDEIYDTTIVQPTYSISNSFLYKIVDVKIIDGIINGSAWIVDKTAGIIRRLQTGLAQNYAVMIVVGIVTLISYVLIF
jgi:NADH-quinone oxidoreductase subunit L